MTDSISFQFTMIEDEEDKAVNFVNALDLSDFEPSISYVTDDDSFSNSMLSTVHTKIFWVDVHHGPGRDFQGIEWIKDIKKRYPHSLVIVVTGYGDRKQKCLDAGADFFFTKGGEYAKNIKKIRSEILKFLKKNKENFDVKEYYASVVHVGQESVKLHCYVDGEIIDSLVPIGLIMASVKEELIVNISLKVSIIYNANSIKIVFNNVTEIPEGMGPKIRIKNEDEDDLLDSEFWTNKL